MVARSLLTSTIWPLISSHCLKFWRDFAFSSSCCLKRRRFVKVSRFSWSNFISRALSSASIFRFFLSGSDLLESELFLLEYPLEYLNPSVSTLSLANSSSFPNKNKNKTKKLSITKQFRGPYDSNCGGDKEGLILFTNKQQKYFMDWLRKGTVTTHNIDHYSKVLMIRIQRGLIYYHKPVRIWVDVVIPSNISKIQ